jgi:hypothetical protein
MDDRDFPNLSGALAAGAGVTAVGCFGLALAQAGVVLGLATGPPSPWISPPLGAAVALLLALPRRRRPRFVVYAGLHAWALLAGWLGRQAWLALQRGAGPGGVFELETGFGGLFLGALLAGVVTTLQALGSLTFRTRHPPAQATALVVLLTGPTTSELLTLGLGLFAFGAWACFGADDARRPAGGSESADPAALAEAQNAFRPTDMTAGAGPSVARVREGSEPD